MTGDGERRGLIAPLSFFLGLLLTVVPIPEGWGQYRPDWIALMCVYFVLKTPESVGLVTAFVLGLLLDALKGQLLGQHALALVLLAYLVLKSHLRVRVFPLGQQTVFVVAIMLAYHFMLFWVDGVAGEPLNWPRRWLPLVADAVAWPVLVILLDAWRGGTAQR